MPCDVRGNVGQEMRQAKACCPLLVTFKGSGSTRTQAAWDACPPNIDSTPVPASCKTSTGRQRRSCLHVREAGVVVIVI